MKISIYILDFYSFINLPTLGPISDVDPQGYLINNKNSLADCHHVIQNLDCPISCPIISAPIIFHKWLPFICIKKYNLDTLNASFVFISPR